MRLKKVFNNVPVYTIYIHDTFKQVRHIKKYRKDIKNINSYSVPKNHIHNLTCIVYIYMKINKFDRFNNYTIKYKCRSEFPKHFFLVNHFQNFTISLDPLLLQLSFLSRQYRPSLVHLGPLGVLGILRISGLDIFKIFLTE